MPWFMQPGCWEGLFLCRALYIVLICYMRTLRRRTPRSLHPWSTSALIPEGDTWLGKKRSQYSRKLSWTCTVSESNIGEGFQYPDNLSDVLYGWPLTLFMPCRGKLRRISHGWPPSHGEHLVLGETFKYDVFKMNVRERGGLLKRLRMQGSSLQKVGSGSKNEKCR